MLLVLSHCFAMLLSGKNGTGYDDEPAMTDEEIAKFEQWERAHELQRMKQEENDDDMQEAFAHSMTTFKADEEARYGGGG